MSDEMHDWLTHLGRGDQAAATLVAEAPAALLGEGERLGPRLGLTRARVEARMNVAQDSVPAIEQAELGASEVRTLATSRPSATVWCSAR
jgi:hypothetical protein